MSFEEIKKQAQAENLPLHTVAAEVIQIAFLDALYAQKESTEIAFHGGTSIHFLHGGYRYSEDLDFVIPTLEYKRLAAVVEKAAKQVKHILTTIIGNLEIELTPRPVKDKNIYTWWLKVIPFGYRGKIHLKLEFGKYPIYQPRSIPFIFRHPLIPLQPITLSPSIEELFADKVNALAGRRYAKHRDFFDIWYLTTVLKPALDDNLLKSKFRDYHTLNPVETLKQRLIDLKPKELAGAMELFLPEKYRIHLSQNQYQEMIEVNQKFIHALLKKLS